MANNSLLIIILTLCAACGSIQDPRPIKSTDPTFYPFIEDFEDDYQLEVNVPIGFSDDIKAGIAAQCTSIPRSSNNLLSNKTIYFKYIIVSTKYWRLFSNNRRKALIYHELIHCQFNYHEHIDSIYTDGCPTNIMSKFLTTDYCINKYWSSYVKYWQ